MSTQEIYELFLQTAGISTDSRTVKSNEFYIALKGENFDGNLFAEDALKKGAAYALVKNGFKLKKKDKSLDGRIVEVNDPLQTLAELANLHRNQFKIPIIAITGTNGKTTTKELVSSVLITKYRIVKTEGNLNNHIGVPLTLLRIMPSTEIAIIEMGANKISDIADLCKIAEPTHGIITNIGIAHLEGFGSKAGVTEAKGKLYEWLRDHQGTVFVNKTDNDLVKLAYSVDPRRFLKHVWYGEEVVPENKELFGSFNQDNMRTAYAVGQYFKVDTKEINKALKDFSPRDKRSERITTAKENDVIIDAYNANPSSMKAALKAFADLKTEKSKWVILGDMKELGEETEKEHKGILWELLKLGLTNVILVGEEFYKAHETKRYAAFKTLVELNDSHFSKGIRKSAVLVKGSNSMKMWEVLKDL